MRLISLVLGLAALLWVIFTYQGSGTAIDKESDKTVKQQYQQSIDEAKQATDALQKSLEDQARRLQQTQE